MKRAFVILAVCIVLSAVLGISTSAQGPDTTPPLIWGFGLSATTVKTTGCVVGNYAIQVQAKASDQNGIQSVMTQYKRPGDLAWQTYSMAKKSDGYYRYYIPKTVFTRSYIGTWQVRIVAKDSFGNSNYSGVKKIQLITCAGTL